MIFQQAFLLFIITILNACSGAAGPGGPVLEDLKGAVMPPVSIPAPTLTKPNAGLVAATKPDTQGIVTVIGMKDAIDPLYRDKNHQIALSLKATDTSQPICNAIGVTCCPIATNGSFDCTINADIHDVVNVYLTDGLNLSEPALSQPDANLKRVAMKEMPWSPPNEITPANATGLCPTTADDWTWNPGWDLSILLSERSGISLCQENILTGAITLADANLYQKVKVTSDGRVRFAALVNRSEKIREGLLFDIQDPESPISYLPASQDDIQLLAFDSTPNGEVISIIQKGGQQELVMTNGLESKSTKITLIGMGNQECTAQDLRVLGDTIIIKTDRNIFFLNHARAQEAGALTLTKKYDGMTFMQNTVDMTLSDDNSQLLVLTQRAAQIFQIQDANGILPLETIRESRQTIPLQKSLKRYGDMKPEVLRIKTLMEENHEIVLIALSQLGLLTFDVSEAVNESPEEPQNLELPLINESL